MKFQYKYIVALIYTVVLFLDRLDLTIVNVTFPTLARYFNIPVLHTNWLSMAFLIALAISIPISSWLGDRFGLKKTYIAAMMLFGLGSTLCPWAGSLNELIFLRFIQGIGGGLLIPIGMTMLYQTFDKKEYASITSFTFLPSLVAPAIAPFLGGILLDLFSWRVVFLFSGPICLVLAVLSLFLLKQTPLSQRTPLDWKGFVLSSAILIDLSILYQ